MADLVSLLLHLLVLALLVLLAVAAWCGRREVQRLRVQLRELARRLEEQSLELDGLCAVGVQLDRTLGEQGGQVRECRERLQSLQAAESANSPYHGAIEMIRKGAAAVEVSQQLGISLSEAELLVRLHRPG